MPPLRSICFVGNGVIDRHATIKRAFGMAPWLRKAGVDVSIVCENAPANHAAAKATGARIETYARGGIPGERAQKLRLVRRQKYDLVHICGLGWRNDIKPRGKTAGMYIMDHVELESCLSGVSRIRRTLQRYLEWRSLSRYDGAVVASRFLRDSFQGRQRGPILYLPYGADPFAANAERGADEIRKKQGLTRFVLYAGGIYRNYGIWTMVDAVRSVIATFPDFQLVIVGRGPEENELRQAVREQALERNIKLLGYVSQAELDGLMLNAEGLMAPLNDTIADRARCPSKIPMYMMAGRPIITCKIGEAWEYLRESGRYYVPGDVGSLTNQFINLWRAAPGFSKPVDPEVSWEWLTGKYLEFWAR
jgi:glycosyltransferase involved in cell wall biosynthesis